MATAYGPSIVRDGLVLCIDAANPKSLLKTVEVLVVGGGGGGGTGSNGGGGGGAGGLLYSSSYSVSVAPGTAIAVTVGDGGAGSVSRGMGLSGSNSVFGTLTATGGGGGGGGTGGFAGLSGGSGGGSTYGSATRTAGTSGQGNAGGGGASALGKPLNNDQGGGGGGAGAAGSDGPGSSGAGGAGGVGLQFSISGTPTYYAGGGGGSSNDTTSMSVGGLGGGGAGGSTGTLTGVAGTANTGGGGGAGNGGGGNGGAGGSGVVIVRYFGPTRASGGTITYVDGYTIHTFTTVGSTTFTLDATILDLTSINTVTAAALTYAANDTFSFNGTSDWVYATRTDGFLNLGVANNFYADVGYAWTVSAWFKFPIAPVTTKAGNSSYAILGNGGGIGGGETLTLFVGSGSDTTYGSYAPYYCAVGIRGTKTIISPSPVNTNTWNHAVVTWNGTAARVYFNGVDRGAASTATGAGIQNGYYFSIGQVGGAAAAINAAQLYEGSIAAVQVYNRALSATEVIQNFDAHRGRFGV